ncbi:hypothetical protein P4V95_04670 [Bacillus thuringiensis]|nr:hypothetical protein [Bacillus thuringiensis]
MKKLSWKSLNLFWYDDLRLGRTNVTEGIEDVLSFQEIDKFYRVGMVLKYVDDMDEEIFFDINDINDYFENDLQQEFWYTKSFVSGKRAY